MENKKFLDVILEFFILPSSSIEKELIKRDMVDYDYEIIRKSIDSRKNVRIFYRLKISLPIKIANKLLIQKRVLEYKENFQIEIPKIKIKKLVYVIGAGPSGLFAAYYLLLSGVKVILVEQGKSVEEREKDISIFFKNAELNEFSNIQNGEGGAGTFSDGKLGTRVKSPIKSWIYQKLVDFGAPEEILYLSKPHIGTDKLKNVIKSFRKELIHLGCDVRFNTELIDFDDVDRGVSTVYLKNTKSNEVVVEKCASLFLGVGNSSRKIFKLLKLKNIDLELKPIAVGYRVIHPQKTIDKNQYGSSFGMYKLPASEYALTSRVGNDNIYSFCMCPGGYVVNSTSEKNSSVSNGMSNYSRSSGYANSAVVVNINPEFFNNDIESAINFQRKIEKRGYDIGGSEYGLPSMDFGKFVSGKAVLSKNSSIKKSVFPFFSLKKDIKDIYTGYEFINKDIKQSLYFWNKKIKKWGDEGLLVVGPETRTSSPVRILRGDNCQSTNLRGFYPIGEGAGYAGGITSSAIDGVKSAIEFVKNIDIS